MKAIIDLKIKNISGNLAISFVIFGIFILGIIAYVSHNPDFRTSLIENISSFKTLDLSGKVLDRGTNINLDAISPKAKILSIYVRKKSRISNNDALYLTPIQSPIRAYSGNSIVFMAGDFNKNTPPKSLDIIFPVELTGKAKEIRLDIRLSSLSGSHLVFLKKSGFGDKAGMMKTKFAKSFLTNTGNLTLAAVFLAFALILFLIWINLGRSKRILYLMLATIFQAWIALWFSRIAYDIIFQTATLHRVSFIVYFLFLTTYSLFIRSYITNKKLSLVCNTVSAINALFANVLIVAALFFSMKTNFLIYKYSLIYALLVFFFLAFAEARNMIRSLKDISAFKVLLPAASFLIALGHGNDILRVYSMTFFPYNLGPYSYFLAINLYITSVVFFLYSNYRDILKKEKNHSKLIAVGQTASMLAHDVRKPFSSVKSILNQFDQLKSNPSFLNKAKHDIERSMTNVERMISDITDLSREVVLEVKPSSLFPILDFSLKQVIQNHKCKHTNITYDCKHTKRIMVDDERLSRVFVNILSNAVEIISMDQEIDEGEIVISTKDFFLENELFVSITLSNNGPYLNEKDIPQLFESFFTKGKKRGTGLGLASAQHIIHLHKGTIRARNRIHSRGVEFNIQLPASSEKEIEPTLSLPKSANGEQKYLVDENNEKIDSQINQLSDHHCKFKILLLEDEALYRASVKNTIRKDPRLDTMITIYDAHDYNDAIELLTNVNITHAIVDIDLGEEKNGFDFLKYLQDNQIQIHSMVHSNRCSDLDKDKSLALGACALAPKPLTLKDIITLLSSGHEEKQGKKQTVLFADDDLVARSYFENLIQDIHPGIDVHIFENAESLLKKLKEIGNCSHVISDQNMGTGMTGTELVKAVRNMNMDCKMYIFANEPESIFEQTVFDAGADGYYTKPVDRTTLSSLLK